MLIEFKKFKLLYLRSRPGFSILEIVVVMTIISFGMVGLLSLTTQAIKAQTGNKNALIAAALAQEGLELVRNYRDTNWKTGAVWNAGLGNGTSTIDYLSPTTLTPVADINAAGARIYLNVSGYYNHSGTTLTPFRRIITTSGNATSTTVTCLVRHVGNAGASADYKAETILYDWY